MGLDPFNADQLGSTAQRKNAVINGDFRVWQRGTSGFTVWNAFNADRWTSQASGGGGTEATATRSRQTHTPGQTDVPGNPKYYWRNTNSTEGVSLTSSAFHDMFQKIEGVATFSGETVTVSFYARSDITNKTLGFELFQSFGSGGSPSASVSGIGGTTLTLTSTFTRYSITIDVPSISGKTLGNNGNDALLPVFWFQGGSDFDSRLNMTGGFGWEGTGTIDIADVQVEKGASPTDFERLFDSEVLTQCQRYYEIGHEYILFSAVANTHAFIHHIPYKAQKRISAAIFRSTISTFALSSTAIFLNNSEKFAVRAVSNTTTNCQYQFTWTADAEL